MNAKTMWSCSWMAILSGVILFLGYPVDSLAAHHEDKKTTAAELKQDAAETYETFKQYTIEQREEAMTAAQKKLEDLDQRISELQKDIDKKWQDMSVATRDKTRETLDTLRKKRENLAEWLGGIRYSSKEAWEDVKKGFADSYDRMERAFEEASKDISSKQTR